MNSVERKPGGSVGRGALGMAIVLLGGGALGLLASAVLNEQPLARATGSVAVVAVFLAGMGFVLWPMLAHRPEMSRAQRKDDAN